jgi:integrase
MVEALTESKGDFEHIETGLIRHKASNRIYAYFWNKGKPFRKSLKTTNLSEARRLLRTVRRDAEQLNVAAQGLTVEEVTTKYLASQTKFGNSTQVRAKSFIKLLLATWEGPKRVKDVTQSDIDVWMSKQKAAHDWKPRTYNEYRRILGGMFKIAVDDKVVLASPVQIPRLRKEKPIKATPTVEEFQAIVADVRAQKLNADAEDSANFLEFMGQAGVGNSEAAAASWKDVNFDKGEVIIYRNKTDKGYVVPMYPGLRAFLERRRDGKKHEPHERLFKICDARKALRNSCGRLKLPHYTQRSLRRMLITKQLEDGVSVPLVARWQGHTDGGALILTTYSHVRPKHEKEIAAKFCLFSIPASQSVQVPRTG